MNLPTEQAIICDTTEESTGFNINVLGGAIKKLRDMLGADRLPKSMTMLKETPWGLELAAMNYGGEYAYVVARLNTTKFNAFVKNTFSTLSFGVWTDYGITVAAPANAEADFASVALYTGDESCPTILLATVDNDEEGTKPLAHFRITQEDITISYYNGESTENLEEKNEAEETVEAVEASDVVVDSDPLEASA